jgi:uncharacterized protein
MPLIVWLKSMSDAAFGWIFRGVVVCVGSALRIVRGHFVRMNSFTPIPSFLGGCLIGLSSIGVLLLHGRVAGISGILGGLLAPRDAEWNWRAAFIAGLLSGGALSSWLFPAWFDMTRTPSGGALVVAGLIVGFGTRLGSGCTSGHGVCGIGRLSPRSIVATAVFMSVAALVVWVVRLVRPEGS